MVDRTTLLINITVAVPKAKETEDALSNGWGVV